MNFLVYFQDLSSFLSILVDLHSTVGFLLALAENISFGEVSQRELCMAEAYKKRGAHSEEASVPGSCYFS